MDRAYYRNRTGKERNLLSHPGFDTDQHAIRFASHPRAALSVGGVECFGFRQTKNDVSFLMPEHNVDDQARHTLELKTECIDAIQAKRDALLHLHGYGIGFDGFNLTEFANKHIGAAAEGRNAYSRGYEWSKVESLD